MKEEGMSSSCDPAAAAILAPRSPTPAASSAGASSPAFPMNVGSTDGLGQGQSSRGGYLSQIAFSSSAGGSAFGSSQPSCRPWERGDLLRRLSTFTPSNWSGRPKAASSLACARKGWVNVNADKIGCELCGANLEFISSAMWTSTDADTAAEDFSKNLDEGHKGTCPWKGNSCAESLVQFPPTPPSALVGGFKDRCDGLIQFDSLPIVAVSAIEQMRASHGPEINRFIAQSLTLAGGVSGRSEVMCGADNIREDVLLTYAHAQKLISLCGWEPRWLPNVQDCEENSAQSARNGGSVGPSNFRAPPRDPGRGKKVLSAKNNKIEVARNHGQGLSCRGESRSPLLDCSLCGATVRIWDFRTVDRPACFAANNVDIPETSKKMGLTRRASAASGISGWVAADGTDKEQIGDLDEAATGGGGKSLSNIEIDLNLTIVGGASTTNVMSEQYQEIYRGKSSVIRQPSSSEVGDRAASYESRGPSTRKRNLDEGGSTVDRPLSVMQQADSIEGTVIDRDGDEVNDGSQYSAGPSKRVREAEGFESHRSLYGTDLDGAGPSRPLRYEMGTPVPRDELFDQGLGVPSTRDSAHASSVVAMDTICHTGDDDSMESVENYPGDMDDVHFPSTSNYRGTDANETSELNYSAQAQHSVCPAVVNTGELGVSSTNDEEVLNADIAAANGNDGPSFGVSGGSVGMGASHEAEIHGIDAFVHRAENDVGDVEPITEITDNQGQTGEYVSDPGLMGDYVPEEIDREDPNGDSQDIMSHSVGKADSGSKIIGSSKAESVESGEKTSNVQLPPSENDLHPSLSCNAIVCSGYEVSKEEVTQAQTGVPADESGYVESRYLAANGTGPSNGESNYDNSVEFDPINHHNIFCPWVNGNVAIAGCTSSSGSSPSAGAVAFSGWQLTLDALDAVQSFGNVPIQTVESESAASLYKDDHRTTNRKLLAHHSFNKSRGPS